MLGKPEYARSENLGLSDLRHTGLRSVEPSVDRAVLKEVGIGVSVSASLCTLLWVCVCGDSLYVKYQKVGFFYCL